MSNDSVASDSTTPSLPTPLSLLRSHYTSQNYIIHSGLQFGVDLVLYASSPTLVHSDFAVVLYNHEWSEEGSSVDEGFDWRRIQSLTRSMPDLHKKLIIARVVLEENNDNSNNSNSNNNSNNSNSNGFRVEEIKVSTFHRSFKVKREEKVRPNWEREKRHQHY